MTKTADIGLPRAKENILIIAEEVFEQYSFAGASIWLINRPSPFKLLLK